MALHWGLPDSTQWPWLRLLASLCDGRSTLPWSTLKGAPAQLYQDDCKWADRYQNYEEMPQDGRIFGPSFPALPMEIWSGPWLDTRSCTTLRLGHVGHSWEREEFDLDFKANKPVGDSHHLAFGFSAGKCHSMLTMWLPIHGTFYLLFDRFHKIRHAERIFQFWIMGIA